MRRIDFYGIKRGDNLGDPETWNKRFEDIDLRLAASEDAMKVVDEVADRAEKAALSRINDVVTPLAAEALQRLTNVATIFEATSDTEVTIGEGVRQFIVPNGQRATFVPLAYLVIFPPGDLDHYFVAHTSSYDRANGVLLVDVIRTLGEGTFSDWQIAPIAFVSELDALAAAAAASANSTAADRIVVAADKATTVTAKNEAVSAKDTAVSAKTAAQAALLSFLTVYRGALADEPTDGQIGHFYFDTDQQMAKVYTSTGWSPLFSLSLGGIRQGELTATAGQTVFNVGSFTFMNVWLNGVKLVAGVDFTVASPNVTLAEGAAAGDNFSYLGYYATEITDFYSKEQVNDLFDELGSAATKDVGTAANNVVQLDGTGKLPAVDASQVTGLATVAKSGSYNDLGDKPTIPAAPTDRVTQLRLAYAGDLGVGTFLGNLQDGYNGAACTGFYMQDPGGGGSPYPSTFRFRYLQYYTPAYGWVTVPFA